MRDSWTDDRLDDLNRKVDKGFNRLDADIHDLRGEIGELRGEMNARFDAMQRGFDTRFDALQHVLLQLGSVGIAGLLGVIATLIATQV